MMRFHSYLFLDARLSEPEVSESKGLVYTLVSIESPDQSQNLLHLQHDYRPSPLYLTNPAIQRPYPQDSIRQLDRRGSSNGLSHGELPGKVRPLFRRWLSPDDFSKDP
jgi:hypothetical protein